MCVCVCERFLRENRYICLLACTCTCMNIFVTFIYDSWFLLLLFLCYCRCLAELIVVVLTIVTTQFNRIKMREIFFKCEFQDAQMRARARTHASSLIRSRSVVCVCVLYSLLKIYGELTLLTCFILLFFFALRVVQFVVYNEYIFLSFKGTQTWFSLSSSSSNRFVDVFAATSVAVAVLLLLLFLLWLHD